MIRTLISLYLGVLLLGCGDGANGPDAAECLEHGGAACFQLPTAPMTTGDGEVSTIGCGPVVPTPSTEAVTYTGFVEFFGTGAPIAGAQVDNYASGAFDTPVASATSAADGSYSMTFPAGTPNVLWAEVTGEGALLNYRLGFRLDLASGDVTEFDIAMFTAENIEGASVIVEERWDPERAGIAGVALDCDQRVIMHAAVAVSSTSGSREPVDGVAVFYGAPGAVPIVVLPEDRGDTNDNGLFAVFRVPPGDSLFLQTWGFPDEAAMAEGEDGLVLVGERPIHAAADAFVQAFVEANQPPP